MIATILCWLVSGPKLPGGNRLHRYLIGFILVMITSWVVSPYQASGQATVENYVKYAVFYVLLVTSVRDTRDLRKIIGGYVCVMTLFMLHTLREYFCGNVWYAQGIMRLRAPGYTFSDYNDFAGLVVCSLPLAWIFWYEWTDWRKRAILAGYFGLSGYCVMLTASRMGACGFVVAGALAGLASPHRWRLLVISLPLLAAIWIVLPEKHQQRYLTIIDPSAGSESARNSAGNLRYGGFEKGLGLFKQRPLLGFGPQTTAVASRTTHMAHNLYGQLLGELGMVGAVVFGLMGLGIAQNTLEARRITRGLRGTDDLFAWRAILAASASYFLLMFMGWGFNFLFWHVWLWFGGFQIIALYCLKQTRQFASEHEDIQYASEFLGGTYNEKQPC